MIISRTPFRISFFGGGTDYPAWYERHGGSVLAAAVDRYCYLTCRYLPPFFPHRFRIAYSQLESTKTIEEIRHPAVRTCLQFMDIREGVEIHHDSDLPKQSGLGTSSSFAVGLLHVLHRLKGARPTPLDLAREAIHIERDLCGDNVGSQDQVTAAVGGLNRINFSGREGLDVQPLALPADRLARFQRHLMLFFTGFSRTASEIVADQLKNMGRKEDELRRMHAMVDQAVGILAGGGSLRPFGELLHEGWMLKRSLSARIANADIDAMYEAGRKAGAIGGKGGGGFLLFFVEPDRQAAVKTALPACLHVPFSIDFTGTRIIFEAEHTEQNA
jgi:D-glycero-alpha-D-manno-heptose-7-phosphate kinase